MQLKNPVRPLQILSRYKTNRGLIGLLNGSNRVFTTPHRFIYDPTSGVEPVIKRNGQTLYISVEIESVFESGGPGTGFDSIRFKKAPKKTDKLTADYIEAI